MNDFIHRASSDSDSAEHDFFIAELEKLESTISKTVNSKYKKMYETLLESNKFSDDFLNYCNSIYKK